MSRSTRPTALKRLIMALVLMLTTVTALVAGTGAAMAAPADTINIDGQNAYLNGINVPWGSTSTFGTDIGCDYNPSAFETMFDNLQAYGVNAVRFWVHVDGRCSPTFNADGTVSGVPSSFYSNLDDVLAKARAHNIVVLLVLWAPELTFTSSAYTAVRPTHDSLITNDADLQTYISNVLTPMAQRYNNNPGLLGYEVMNEPEFAVNDSSVWGSTPPTDRDLIPLATMQKFVAEQVVALHQNTTKYVVAVGSAAYKWLASTGVDATVANWWSDSALAAQVPSNEAQYAYSDFYEVHWYDWEKGTGYDFAPWEGRGPTYFNNDNKPVIIGEMPAKADADFTTSYKINESYNEGYLGSFAWSYNGVDQYGSWSDVNTTLKAFRDANPGLVSLNIADTSQTQYPGDAHAGTNSVMLNAAGNWTNLDQAPAVDQYANYTASFWVRGSGTTQLQIDAGQWGSQLAATSCTAQDQWSLCSVNFNSGPNSQVTWRVTDSTSGGTMYVDDTALDDGNGNVLTNPSFEGGSNGWSIESSFTLIP